MLRTLGMTRRQLGTMIAWEGLCYALTAAGATLAIGLPVAVGVLPDGQFPLLRGDHRPLPVPPAEMALFLGVLFGLELLLSGWSIRREEKGGLLERIGQRPLALDMTNAPDGIAVRGGFSLWLWLGFFGLFGLGGGFFRLELLLGGLHGLGLGLGGLAALLLALLAQLGQNSGGDHVGPLGVEDILPDLLGQLLVARWTTTRLFS